MLRRRRLQQSQSFQDRLTAWAVGVRAQAAKLPPGPEREVLLKKIRQADTAAHLSERASSPELQPPK